MSTNITVHRASQSVPYRAKNWTKSLRMSYGVENRNTGTTKNYTKQYNGSKNTAPKGLDKQNPTIGSVSELTKSQHEEPLNAGAPADSLALHSHTVKRPV